MKRMRILLPCLTVLLFSPYAKAESYLGFGIGNASIDLKPLFGTQELEDSPMLKGFLGHHLSENFAVEMDLSLGTFDWVNSSNNSHTVVNISASGVGFIPLGDTFELFAKLGANLSSTAVDVQGSVYEGDTGIGVTYGAGLIINFTEKFALRFEYQVITDIDDGVDNGDLDWASGQIVFKF